MTTTCARCGRILDTGSATTRAEIEYSAKVRPQVDKPYEIWCADCLLKSPSYSNER